MTYVTWQPWLEYEVGSQSHRRKQLRLHVYVHNVNEKDGMEQQTILFNILNTSACSHASSSVESAVVSTKMPMPAQTKSNFILRMFCAGPGRNLKPKPCRPACVILWNNLSIRVRLVKP
jgi:hypothetical protein